MPQPMTVGSTSPSASEATLIEHLRKANERLAIENRYLRGQVVAGEGLETIVGTSVAMRRVVEQVRRVAPTSTTVLLEGSTGSGKELVARAIHDEGPRRGELFVAVNCGGMPEELLASALFGHRRGAFTGAVGDQQGFFALASGGTLFLDEVSEMSVAMQVHLLRALQEGEVQPIGACRPVRVDVRVVAASNRDLGGEVQAGRFRSDLWHRLRVFPIRLPSLAERREDVPALAEHLLRRLAPKVGKTVAGFTPDAVAALVGHDYEGNVRELANLIERALILCPAGEAITEDHLFDRVPGCPAALAASDGQSLRDEIAAFARRRILETIGACGGNKSAAARRLGLSYRGLLMKMQRVGIVPPAVRRS